MASQSHTFKFVNSDLAIEMKEMSEEKKKTKKTAEETGEEVGRGIRKGAKAVKDFGKGLKKELERKE